MFLTKEEIRTAMFALIFSKDGGFDKKNVYPMNELKDATEIFNRMNASVDEEKNYVDGDIELNTSQRALLIRCLDREWSPADGVNVLSLKEKLEK